MIKELHAPFPKESIRWRAQTVTKDGKSAMALAYIDARDVMDRLDRVAGVGGWQCKHYDCGAGRMGCKIGILFFDEDDIEKKYGSWVWKSDGAGATAVEGDKGAFSDAFKRAAVQWGVGRYLYALGTTWVPCESYKTGDRWKFKKFTDDPWNHVKKQVHEAAKGNVTKAKEKYREFISSMADCTTEEELDGLLCAPRTEKLVARFREVIPEWSDDLDEAIHRNRERFRDGV